MITPCCVQCKRPALTVSLNMRSLLGNFYLICDACEARRTGQPIRYSDSSVVRQPGTVPDCRVPRHELPNLNDGVVVNPKGDPNMAQKLQQMLSDRAETAQDPANHGLVLTKEMSPLERHMLFRLAIGRPALHIEEAGVASALEKLFQDASTTLRYLANHDKAPDGEQFDVAAIRSLARRLANAHRGTIQPLVALAQETVKQRGLTEPCDELPIPAVFNWSAGWLANGFNHSISTAINALEYLADNPRSSYGEARYNAEHLFDIASSVLLTWERLLAPLIVRFGFSGEVARLLNDTDGSPAARLAMAKLVATGTINLDALVQGGAGDEGLPIGRGIVKDENSELPA